MVTDRPDFTESTDVVRPGMVQVEMGATLDREGSARHFSQGEILTRTGLTNRIELRLGGEGLSSLRESGSGWQRGLSDAEIGLKIRIWDERRHLPAFSVIPILSVPIGSSSFSSGG